MHATTAGDHLVNHDLIKIAQDALRSRRASMGGFGKSAFVPGGDPAAGAPPGGDPAAGGMDPSMMMGGAPPGGGGMDPMMAGGMPPPPSPGGNVPDMQQMILQKLTALEQGGGGAGAGGGGIKPKIDVNVALMQISKMLARIADSLGIQIPAHEMIATPQDLGAMANQQQSGGPGGPAPAGAIPPIGGIDPMQGSGSPGAMPKQGSYVENGKPFDGSALSGNADRAAAIARIRKVGRR